ncbi:hypothetical protein QR680_017401 [Steinernema hermaphroditum]|uniref:UDP-glucose:glycoprotein glucosyltransferase n=1 Tax=Steinernema hermaphroditum TaxID=289476 RepID=A0AA39HEF1_9BILA|nr:hypothetical protein QR680_017401 [Steinernema hermaphroditum]
MTRSALLWLLLLSIGCSFVCGSSKKPVIASVTSKWNQTSLLAESSEYFASESNDRFWAFISEVAERVNPDEFGSYTPQKVYDTALKLSTALLGGSTNDMLKWSLSLRVHSPAVEMQYQLGREYDTVDCDAFVDINGKTSCDASEIEKLLKSSTESSTKVLSTDHIHLSAASNGNAPVLVVYGDIGSKSWLQLHTIARSLSANGKVRYVLRHFRRNGTETPSPVCLSGYGVELAIKNTEYKAVDDSAIKKDDKFESDEDLSELDDVAGLNFNILKKRNSHLRGALKKLWLELSEKEELSPLKQWEVQDLGYQAAQSVLDADPEDAIAHLVDLSQNFPTYARALSQVSVKPALRKEIELNQENAFAPMKLDSGDSALYVNGIPVDLDAMDIFQILSLLKKEEALASAFHKMNIGREYLGLLLGDGSSDDQASHAVDFREGFPEYLNDLDKDKMYRGWGNSVKMMLQPYYPGMIRPIARNFFTLIFAIDPSHPESRSLIKTAYSFYSHQVAMRIGFIFVTTDDREAANGMNDASVALLNFYNFVKTERSTVKAVYYLSKLLDNVHGRIEPADVHDFFRSEFGDQDIAEVFGSDSDYDNGRSAGAAFLRKSKIGNAPKVLLNGVILDDEGIKGDKFEETVINEVMKQTPKIQMAVMKGRLTDRDNVMKWIMSQPEVLPRINARVLDVDQKFAPLSTIAQCSAKSVSNFAALDADAKGECIMERMKYLTKSEDDITRWFNVWVVGDMDSDGGRDLLANAMKHLKKSNSMRLGVLQNSEKTGSGIGKVAKLIYNSIRLLPNHITKQMLIKLTKADIAKKIAEGTAKLDDVAVQGLSVDSFRKETILMNYDLLHMEALYSQRVLGLKIGQRAVVVNGMIIGPFDEGESFEAEDFALLETVVSRRGAESAANVIDRWDIHKRDGKSSDVLMRVLSTIGALAQKKTRSWMVFSDDVHSVVTLTKNEENRPAVDVVAVVDPLSKSGQKLAPILQLIFNIINCDMKIAMNPRAKLSELPLKRFYRFVANTEPLFDKHGSLISPMAIFTDLPSKQLLTMSVIPPDSWMVQPISAKYDLDNIKMDMVGKSGVISRFELVTVLLEGHCFDEVTGGPPRGLQFTMGTESRPELYDTIVMANLGYFQLKASPGAWIVSLREGRSRDIYEIKSHSNTESGGDNEKLQVLINSFSGRTIRVRVAKRPSMQDHNLLDDSDSEGSIFSGLSSAFTGGDKNEVINVFSLASGHLYERFMRIMMLSVIKRTKHPVKFWLLNNYLSPQFRESLPKMAKKYNIQYELVEYKWPRWLNQQSEKQRVMWGYKILFLDVLFPLNVKKIIFVDADQIVRADLMELMNLDLGGAPYGFTPFCDSRKSMDGFRFWKQGYWANHLAGRRYHISALYVIDLVKFRQLAAGDRLRGQYQGLSADPNSLANLDQDLPNNMIHQVRIKSLPQEWLWCETWCDDESKDRAKTIDLCNNPLTKEPKLDAAVRIVGEWKDYDEEIRNLLNQSAIEESEAKESKHSEL